MENSQLGIPMEKSATMVEFALLTLARHGDGDLPRHGLWFSSKCCLIFWAMVVPVPLEMLLDGFIMFISLKRSMG